MIEIERSRIKNAPYNPRRISKESKRRLRAGVKKHGLLNTPTWNRRTGNLVGGHQRLAILDSLEKDANYKLSVACVDVDEKQEREQNLLLNNEVVQGEWDIEALERMFTGVDGVAIDIDATGFDTASVYRLFGEDVLSKQEQSSVDKLAESLSAATKAYEQIVADSVDHDTDGYYCILVFGTYEERREFTDSLGLDDNRWQDGRRVAAMIHAEEDAG